MSTPAAVAAKPLPTASEVDIMLLLEGTFPYVAGGVSSWVNQIIRGFPEYRFGCVFLGSRPEDYGDQKYPLPDNVVHVERHFMHVHGSRVPVSPKRKAFASEQAMDKLHAFFRSSRVRNASEPAGGCPVDHAALESSLVELDPGGLLSEEQFLYGESAWAYIAEQYRRYCTDPSFVDYFWTNRIMHAPIWRMARLAKELIPAKAYHTISTGYAGLLGALLKRRTGRPLILSEHGIYTKERKIDLFQSEWIRDNRGAFERDASQLAYFKDLWIRFFEALGRICYDQADVIVALYEANRQRQIHDGARPERTMNVPNGINLQRLAALRAKRTEGIPPILCLIGRVVPIKDIETFIRAMRTVVRHIPEAEGWIAGPEDEDPVYAQDCKTLAKSLGVADKVKFLGFQKIDDILPKIGLGILSSISEALPLVILEGYAAGVPVVSTDVGSCRQLVYGFGPDDEAIGPSGRIVRIADGEALGLAAVELLKDPEKWRAAQRAGIERVERFYTQERMFGSYRTIYQRAIAGWPAQWSPADESGTGRGEVASNAAPAPAASVEAAPAAAPEARPEPAGV